MPENFWITFFWLLTYGLIVGVWLWLLFRLYGGISSKSWLKVSAKIIRSNVKRTSLLGLKGSQRLIYPEVAYRYLINGKWYTAKTISFALLRPKAEQVIERYPIYGLVQVFYHPFYPRIAVLEPGLPTADIVFLSICFFWMSLLVSAGLWLIVTRLI
ncbi:MAG: hypothetical protein Fur0022_40180 [Anaerolineales bacterium]